MIQVTIVELQGLQDSVRALENVLETLDLVGAGIAAIHVDAAINQLKNNLDGIEQDAGDPIKSAFACQSEWPPYLP